MSAVAKRLNTVALFIGVATILLSACVGTEPPVIKIDVPERTYISPANADGIQDTFSFPVSILPAAKAFIAGYGISVTDASGNRIRYMEKTSSPGKPVFGQKAKGGVEPPDVLVWEGKDDSGAFAPDGEYSVLIEAWDSKNRGKAGPFTAIVDNTPPTAILSAQPLVFSPNGDGRFDAVTISQEAAAEKEWTATIVDAKGSVVFTKSWQGKPDATVVWDGLSAGKTAPDGEYAYRLRGLDLAGNQATIELKGLVLSTAAAPFVIGLSGKAFSPNGDGVRDQLMMQPVMDDTSGTESWSVDVVDGSGSVVWHENLAEFRQVAWDGSGIDAGPAPEGTYWVRMTVKFQNGNVLEQLSDPILLDRTPPTASVAISTPVFSPDGDGKLDTIQFLVADATQEDDWKAEVVGQSDGSVVRSAAWAGLPGEFQWDGLDEEGRLAAEGWYLYRLYSADEAGNEFATSTQAFVLDVRKTPAAIRALQTGFSPNGDGKLDAMTLELELPVADGIASWSLRVRGAAGGAIRTVEGRDAAPGFASFSWDGADDSGKLAPDGSYTVVLSVRYYKGNEAEAASQAFALDTTPPVLKLDLSPLPFSPDGDGYDDVLDIKLEVKDASAVELWNIAIVDRDGAPFANLGSAGSPPATLRWDGLSALGELVMSAEDYALRATVRDAYGNESVAEGLVPVDILVFKEGDRYLIQVPGIYFSPYSVEFPFNRSADNWSALRRLATVLAKYPDHAIRIEGNAVRVLWADPVRGAAEERQILGPLSKARAERVKTILTGLGIAANRMTTAGLGGTAPLVPHGDLENRWKNRRVDFLLVRR